MTDNRKVTFKFAAREPSRFGAAMVDYLMTLRGEGELPGLPNNSSPFIRMMRSTDGTGKPVATRGAWCAVTGCHAGVVIATRRGIELPFVPSRGARRLTKNIAAAGSWIIPPGENDSNTPILRGDAVCFRGEGWRGHFMLALYHRVESDVLTVIEGNHTNRTALIDGKRYRYAVIDTRTMRGDYWRPRLFGVAGLR